MTVWYPVAFGMLGAFYGFVTAMAPTYGATWAIISCGVLSTCGGLMAYWYLKGATR